MIGDLILFLFWQHEGEAKNARLSITEFFATLRAATLVSVFGT